MELREEKLTWDQDKIVSSPQFRLPQHEYTASLT